jgi:hypothetical protein
MALPTTAADSNTRSEITLSRLSRGPALEDFLGMAPSPELAGQLAKVEDFIQRNPRDGAPSSQRTEVYLGYDDTLFYAIFVCFDSEPKKIRARMSTRENIFGDDTVELMLDTFNDQRRAYAFLTNPFGIQWDALYSERGAAGFEGFDSSFDTLWYSRGKLTDRGYVVWMAVPFKSLRFYPTSQQTWRVLLNRDIPRFNEETFWPEYSRRVEGRLNQMGMLTGLENISPGRNIQLTPYGIFRSFRAPDLRDPTRPQFLERTEGTGGLDDAKFVFKDSVVLDLAVNPDFSEVESDEPQVVVGQRFEVFFPEKRPFFLENTTYFQTPIDLVFTRRIVDPQYGVRLTGKVGPYALGAFLADDESPGKEVPPDNSLAGQRAYFGIVRVNRDIFQQSTLGLLYTDREFFGDLNGNSLQNLPPPLQSGFNRVGGLDGRLKLSQNWVATFQGVASTTKFLDGSRLAGPAYDASIERSGRSLFYGFEYNDRSPGFRTAPGFLLRPDIRRFGQLVDYRFRPEGKHLISWGPEFNTEAVFDHTWLRLDLTQDTSLSWEFTGQTEVGIFYNWDRELIRPIDTNCGTVPENRDFSRKRFGYFLTTSYLRWLTFGANYSWGTRINCVPPVGQEPFLADVTAGNFVLTLRPLTALRIDNTYILAQLHDRFTRANIFTNHIIRSKWNYQFTRELSLRVILQYDAVLANPTFTSLHTTKNINADVLLTYLVHPGTALYIGYNGNAQNLEPDLAQINPPSDLRLLRPRSSFINDGKLFFVKFSYLFRF